MITYQIDGQWYSDPDFLPPKNLEAKPAIPISSAIIHIPKTTVELQPIVQLCAGFSHKKIHSLWVVNAPSSGIETYLRVQAMGQYITQATIRNSARINSLWL